MTNPIGSHRRFFCFCSFLLIQCLMLCQSLAAQDDIVDSCDGHSPSWHKHTGDGYWFSWWKVTFVESDYLRDISESTITDEWVSVYFKQFYNFDCEAELKTIQVERAFTHSVTVGWGSEISASAEGAVKLIFWKAMGEVGARVHWNQTGTDSYTESITVTSQKSLSQCKYLEYFYRVRRMHKEYVYDVADSLLTCVDFSDDSWPNHDHFCNRRDVTVVGVGYIGSQSGWDNPQKICDCDDGQSTNRVELDDEGKPIVDGSTGGDAVGGGASGE